MERVAALDPGLALSYGAAFDLLPFAVAEPAALETRRRELLAWTPPDGCVSRHPVRTYEPATCIRPMVREYLLALVEVHLGMADSVDTRIATFRRHLAEGVNGRHARQFLSEIEAERAWLAGDAREAARVWDADPNHVWYVEALQSLFYSHG
ncbi:MAG: hypothetical protein GWN71_37610, partial [Gammaproteobacteria bacterium]|nr:hypothetical protein [Gammaproteobacteria bacterium]